MPYGSYRKGKVDFAVNPDGPFSDVLHGKMFNPHGAGGKEKEQPVITEENAIGFQIHMARNGITPHRWTHHSLAELLDQPDAQRTKK